ncbi:proprotein convertase P-domain-containing protein [Kribbella turkmenica]|uniref:proprotein convertase P-domain-containing protein n=1 Tax=Kribbella turkmenica TaxID=2530375 RepID=UPI0014055E7E|nr:proprotein convertase P-domain-containing protein [Kribbella turkmenica]
MRKLRRIGALALIAALAGGTAQLTAAESAPAEASSGTPAIIQLGDSFASGEGGGWMGNSKSSTGSRHGTDLAAFQLAGGWSYAPEEKVYEPSTYREQNGHWGQNPCHRGREAPITWVKRAYPSVSKVVNVACSGAKNKNIWMPANGGQEQHPGMKTQLHELMSRISPNDDVKLVSISVGGNDINVGDSAGFGNLVEQCAIAWANAYLNPKPKDVFCKDAFESEIGPAVSNVFYEQLRTIDLVRQTLAAEGQPVGSYRLVLMGYPSITPAAFSDWAPITEISHMEERCPVRRFDSGWIHSHLIKRLNDVIQAATEERGVGFIDPTDAFDGHRLCESGTVRLPGYHQQARYAEWVRYLDADYPSWSSVGKYLINGGGTGDEALSVLLNSQRSLAESLHPNYWGQRALGNCLREYFKEASETGPPIRRSCFVGGVGDFDHPDYMALKDLPAHSKFTDTVNATIGNPITRTITVPTGVTAGHYFQWLPDISHPRKGQLRIHIIAPDGTLFAMRDFNPGDTGAFGNGTSTRDYTGDPSGKWTLKIWDNDPTYNGTMHGWSLKLF